MFCPGLFLQNENKLKKAMEMKKEGEELTEDGVPEPKRKQEEEEDEEEHDEEESERQTPESPESGQSLFSVIAPPLD